MIWVALNRHGFITFDSDQHGAGIGTIMRTSRTHDAGIHGFSGKLARLPKARRTNGGISPGAVEGFMPMPVPVQVILHRGLA